MLTDQSESIRKKIGNIPSIEGLRGLAAIIVVLYHYYILRAWSFKDDLFIRLCEEFSAIKSPVYKGYIGVEIFFILTGFLLIIPWLKAQQSQSKKLPSITKYFQRRFWRIAPAYYFNVLLVFLVFLPIFASPEALFTEFWWSNLGAHLGFAQVFDVAYGKSLNINGALWTLSLEAQYYLLLPLIALLTLRFGVVVPIALIVLSFIWRYLCHAGLHDFFIGLTANTDPDYQEALQQEWRRFFVTHLPGYFSNFGVGIIVAMLYVKQRAVPNLTTVSGWAAILIFVVIMSTPLFASSYGIIQFSISYTQTFLAILLGCSLYFIVLYPNNIANRILKTNFMQFSGKISYSIYLLHIPIILLFNKFFSLNSIAFPAFIICLYVFSHLSFRHIEARFSPNLLVNRKQEKTRDKQIHTADKSASEANA